MSKGLKCVESKYVSQKDIEFETKIPDKGKFQIVSIESLYDNNQGYLLVTTNQEVMSQNVPSLISIDPKVDFKVEMTSSGFYIKANFVTGESYNIVIEKELKGIFGGTLKEKHEQAIVFGPQEPNISFLSKNGIYLTSKGEKNVAIRIINVPKVKVTVIKIYENNILSFLKGSTSYDYEYEDYGYEYDYYGNSNYEDLGDIILDKEYDVNQLKKSGRSNLLNLNFDDINEFKGIYLVRVNATDKQWIKSTKVVSISDVGLIVKETENDIYVFNNSILTTSPVSGTEVSLISSNNQTIYKAVADKDGVAKFEDIKKKSPGFKVKMITAKAGTDFNYLHFNQAGIETSRYDIGGARRNPAGYQAYIYGDRDIYRPGEKIYLNVIVRTDLWEPLAKVPVKVKVILPNGKELINIKGNLNEEGAFTTSAQLPVASITGTYNVEVYSANDILLNSKYISVEEFIPDRIKVNVSLNKEQFALKQEVEATAVALNLFGPPAANRNYEMDFTLKRKYFSPKEYSDYNYDIQGSSNVSFANELRQGTTDEAGKATESFVLSGDYKDMGLLDGKVYVTVFDESGRPVNRIKNFEVYTQDVFYGMKYVDYYVNTKEELKVPLIALNKDGKMLPATSAQVVVIKNTWHTVLEKNYESYRYVSQKKQTIMEDKVIAIKGAGTYYAFRPFQSGEYEIRVSKPGSNSYVSQYFYAYGWGNTDNTSFEVSKEGNVEIQLDKTAYEVGDKANVLFKTPFAGKLLVTVERDKVYEYFYVDTDKKSASVTIPIKEEYLPNAYISATLIKRVDDDAIPLTVAHGFVPLFAEKKSNKIALEIKAPQSSRSRTKQNICVKSNPESDVEVTLAIVDEGILQLKNMKSPDPYEFFFQKRALEVNSYDLYPNLLPELKLGSSSMAGDGYDLEKRVNPLTNNRVKLISYWSGILHTDSDGEACYSIDIPQFSGDLRIMAVAYKGGAFGSASSNMKVADPMVVSTSLPRFLSPGDTVLVPVTLTNTTKAAATANAKLSVTGPLSIIGAAQQSVSVKANGEMQVTFKVLAQAAIGEAHIKTIVNAMNEDFVEDIDITVRPITSLLKQSGSGEMMAGTRKTIETPKDFIPSSMDGKLIVSKSPFVQFSDKLEYLLGYPYGCVEQTVSKAFPQLYFADIAKSLNYKSKSGENPNYNVQEAIRKLQSMQLYNGGLSYWEGGYYESWWGSVYAAHFLSEAKKAGFEVNSNMMDKVYTYLEQKAKEKNTETYYYYPDETSNSYIRKVIAPKDVFYSLYILAGAGRQDVSTMNYYKSNLSMLAIDSKYLLAATYLILGDQASYKAILPSGFNNERSRNAFGGSFYSYVRDMGISLNTLIETDPKNPQIPILARHLSKEINSREYLSTQEMAFAMIALGKLAKKANQSDISAEIKSGGKKIGSFKNETLVLTKDVAGKDLEISAKGTGSLYYFWDIEGLSTSGTVKEEDSFLRVRKTFYDRNGNIISSGSFKQNDLVVVKITLQSLDNSSVENVVITDMLPAGFEIENPRLSEAVDMPWLGNNDVPEHFDIRDDRINLFTTATGDGKTFYYMVRAVSKGTFKMGPVSADAMYNGEYHSYNGADVIRVSGR